MMTNEELDEIMARADAATPGPWTFTGHEYDGIGYPSRMGDIEGPEYFDDTGNDHNAIARTVPREDNALFIAHARTDVPKLVAEVRRLRKELAAMTLRNQLLSAEVKALPLPGKFLEDGGCTC